MMPKLVNSTDDLQSELEQLRRSETLHKERQVVLLRLALSQQNPSQSFDDKLRAFTKEVGDFLKVERTSIWFLDRDNTSLRCLNLYIRGENQHFSGAELPTKMFPRYLKSLDKQGIIAADYARTDFHTEEFGNDYLVKHGITSMLDTPLRVGERLRGVLCCEHVGEPRHWTTDDREFVISLSDLAALTIATHDVGRTEEMLRALLESAAQGVVAVDENGRIALVNSMIEEMFLYERKELLSKPLDVLIPDGFGHSFFKQSIDKVSTRHALVPAVGKFFRGRRKDGTEFPLEIALSNVQLHDERMSLALLTDATERVYAEQQIKKSEELYRSVVEDQVDLIARYNPDGIRTFANDAYCRFIGHPREELIGKPLWEHIPVADHDRMRENFARLTPEQPVLYYEHCDVTAKGKVVVNQWIDRAVFDVDGKLREIQCIGRDVTKQRATEERLTAAERLESIAMLASGIAHDFNNLLTPILIYSENLQTRLREGSIEANQVQQIHLAADRAKTLVRQILTFGRKGERAERKPTLVKELLGDALQLIRLSVPGHIRLQTHIDDNCGSISSDAAEIYQVISNLCSNACYAMSSGGKLSINARCRYVETSEVPPGEYLEVVVEDNGTGISPADLGRIFDPFFSTKPEGEGTGLGLSVVHGTVKDLGGTIKVESQVGEGTRFTVLLPCATESANERQTPTEEDLQPITKSHVLLVDDDDLALKSMQLVLKQLGHRVTACGSAHEALSCLTQSPDAFDVLLSDFTMPRMSGLELAKKVHVSHPALPILLITGDAGKIDENAAKNAGVAGFVDKPASSQELRSALSHVVKSDVAPVAAPPAAKAKRHVLVIDDNELVRGSLLSLLKTIGFASHAAANLTEAKALLAQQPVDAVLVDHHLDGENGFEEVPRLFVDSRAAKGHVPLLVGMTGSEFLSDSPHNQLDAFLTKPFTAEQLREVLDQDAQG
jgi:PAS domain S-box-containing protein